MPSHPDLRAVWTVLATTAAQHATGLDAAPLATQLPAGPVLAGVDAAGNRHLLLPLPPGESSSEDRAGRSVQLVRVTHQGSHYLSAVCLRRNLDEEFTRFCQELVDTLTPAVTATTTTSAAARDVLTRWRQLFAEDTDPSMSAAQEIGLIAELLILKDILSADPARRLDVWTGPRNGVHDFRRGPHALEVKATSIREGRIVPISSVEQLQEPPAGTLHLAHFRLDPSPSGTCLPDVVEAVLLLGANAAELHGLLQQVGYRHHDADQYRNRRHTQVSRRVYDATAAPFPRITATSFTQGHPPPGTLRLEYSIDLTNEPPTPLDHTAELAVLASLAAA